MNQRPNPSDVPQELVELIKKEETWDNLCEQWDRIYPTNPVSDIED